MKGREGDKESKSTRDSHRKFSIYEKTKHKNNNYNYKTNHNTNNNKENKEENFYMKKH